MSRTTDPIRMPPSPQPLVLRVGEVLLIVLVFFVLAGDPAPHVNEPHYLAG